LSTARRGAFIRKCFSKEERVLIENNFEKNKKIFLKVYRERIAKFTEVAAGYRAHEINMFFEYMYGKEFENFDLNKICFKGQTLDEAKSNLKQVREKIENISENEWTAEKLKSVVWDWAGTVGRGQVLHPLRMVMSLRDKSPDPFTIMDIIGRTESLRRIENIV
jgi:glutamyl/glutaminyl-tRNA synthetase